MHIIRKKNKIIHNKLIMSFLNVKKIRNELSLSQTSFGKLLGVGIRTVQLWESGDRKMSEGARILLQKVIEDENSTHLDTHITNEEEERINILKNEIIEMHPKLLTNKEYSLWFEVQCQNRVIKILSEMK